VDRDEGRATVRQTSEEPSGPWHLARRFIGVMHGLFPWERPPERFHQKLAVLIDGDNIAPAAIRGLFAELASHGEPFARRLYLSNAAAIAAWTGPIERHALDVRHQFASVPGKNAVDIRITIEAMDLLIARKAAVFAIVSNDGDFAPLATRIRESGCDVIGYGCDGAATTFRRACTRFFYLENFHLEAVSSIPGVGKLPLRPPGEATAILAEALIRTDGHRGWVAIEDLARSLAQQHTDWDPRTYGCRNLRDLLALLPRFQLHQVGPGEVRVRYLGKKRRAQRA
jgi:Fe-S-cluster formation regulator IscX/YfhJ